MIPKSVLSLIIASLLTCYQSYSQEKKSIDSSHFILLKDSSELKFDLVGSYVLGNNFLMADSIVFPLQKVLSFKNGSGYYTRLSTLGNARRPFLKRDISGNISTFAGSINKVVRYFQIKVEPIQKINYRNLENYFKSDPMNLERLKSINKKVPFLLILGSGIIILSAVKLKDCSGLSKSATSSFFFGGGPGKSPHEVCQSDNIRNGLFMGAGLILIFIGKNKKRKMYIDFINTYNQQTIQ